jgi:hypothetical protein
MGLEQGPLSLVSTIEELLERRNEKKKRKKRRKKKWLRSRNRRIRP